MLPRLYFFYLFFNDITQSLKIICDTGTIYTGSSLSLVSVHYVNIPFLVMHYPWLMSRQYIMYNHVVSISNFCYQNMIHLTSSSNKHCCSVIKSCPTLCNCIQVKHGEKSSFDWFHWSLDLWQDVILMLAQIYKTNANWGSMSFWSCFQYTNLIWKVRINFVCLSVWHGNKGSNWVAMYLFC